MKRSGTIHPDFAQFKEDSNLALPYNLRMGGSGQWHIAKRK
jgi:hypothetical protein